MCKQKTPAYHPIRPPIHQQKKFFIGHLMDKQENFNFNAAQQAVYLYHLQEHFLVQKHHPNFYVFFKQ